MTNLSWRECLSLGILTYNKPTLEKLSNWHMPDNYMLARSLTFNVIRVGSGAWNTSFAIQKHKLHTDAVISTEGIIIVLHIVHLCIKTRTHNFGLQALCSLDSQMGHQGCQQRMTWPALGRELTCPSLLAKKAVENTGSARPATLLTPSTRSCSQSPRDRGRASMPWANSLPGNLSTGLASGISISKMVLLVEQ